MACEHNTDFIAKLNEEPLGTTNASNIAAMVANPADLVRGHGGGPSDAAVSALPIERFETDHTKALGGASTGEHRRRSRRWITQLTSPIARWI